MMYDVNNIW